MSVHDPPWLHFQPLNYFNPVPDTDLAFRYNADPDPACKNYVDPEMPPSLHEGMHFLFVEQWGEGVVSILLPILGEYYSTLDYVGMSLS
jgi:hypothetical protein